MSPLPLALLSSLLLVSLFPWRCVALSCICGTSPCERPSCCTSGLYTDDACGCCKVCAKAKGEVGSVSHCEFIFDWRLDYDEWFRAAAAPSARPACAVATWAATGAASASRTMAPNACFPSRETDSPNHFINYQPVWLEMSAPYYLHSHRCHWKLFLHAQRRPLYLLTCKTLALLETSIFVKW